MAKESTDRVFLQNSIKTLATNIRFASVDNPVSTLTITSSVPNEGKSTIAIALAQAMASNGQRALLVECDMRRRTLAGALGVHTRSGIYSVLSGQVDLSDAVVETSTRTLHFLDCEPHIPNPVDILSSHRFEQFVEQVRSDYSFVIFDTPPLSAFVDAAILSTVVDATLLVVRQNFVRRDELISSFEQLKKADANVIGVVMNYCENEKSDYYYSYYTKDGKKKRTHRYDAVSTNDSVSISQPVPVAVKDYPSGEARSNAASHQARSTVQSKARAAAPGIRPIPTQHRISPDSTAQFLAGTNYRPRPYEDD